MQRRRGWIVFGLTLASTAFLLPSLVPILVGQTTGGEEAPATSAAPVVKRHHKSHKIAPPIVLPPMPAGPLHQLPMDQIPATPARVTFEGGLLTISAQNSTLAEILRDVRKLTGASIEIPPGANERVVANVYPNNPPPQEQPGMPQRFPRPGGPFNGQPIIAQPANGQTTDADDSKDDDADNADDSADDSSAQAQPGQAQPDGTPAVDQQQQPDPNQPNAGPKTPEQILEMLRRSQPGQTPLAPPPPQPEQ
jgi:hypothetical protein